MYYAESGRRKRRPGIYLISAVLLALLLIGALAFWQLSSRQTWPTVQFADKTTGLRLVYDQRLATAALSAQDHKDNVLLRLTQKTTHDAPLQVTVRYEKGLRPLEAITKQRLRDALLANASKTYPVRFPGYKEIQRHSFALASHDAGELIFSYTGPKGESIQQHFLIFVVDDDRAVYVSAQSKTADFSQLDRSYFESLLATLHT